MTKEIPLIRHIEELRKRIIYSLLAVISAALFAYIHKEKLLLLLTRYIEKTVFLAPHEAFVSYLKLSLACGFFLASPFILYQVWAFVSCGLDIKEKKYTLFYGIMSIVLFLSGISFGYFLGLPLAMDFLLGFANTRLQPMLSIGNYINFSLMLILVFGLLFEGPLAVFFVTQMGLISPGQLSSKRKHIIVAVFIIAAVLTPPDVATQFLVAVPLYILLEVSILLSRAASGWRQKRLG